MKMKWGNKDVETAVPLLPEFVSERNNFEGASVSGAVFNVSTTIVGAGIMSIPATMKVLGVIPAFILIFVIAVLSEISARFLLKYTHCGDSTTYAGVMAESFGRLGGLAVQICILITNIGALIIYLIIIESLRFTSAISVLLAVVFVGISAVIALSALWEGKTKTPRLLPDLVNQASFFDLFTAVPVIVTAFTFHFNVHPIGAELRRPCDMVSAVRISLILCSIIYCSVGFFGYLLFGDSIMSDILVNFDRNSGSTISSLLNDTVRLSYALHLVLVFPLLNFSLRANIDELLFAKSPILASDNNRFWALTCGLLGLIYIAAIAIPNIWYFFQFMGSTTAVCLAFIFPGAIVLRDVHEVSTGSDRISAAVMIVLAIVTSSIAISTNITNLTRSKL
ncbi:PREDICTED: probable sodium-coupled neutral amino acid transporter 6 isoform X2 [Nelumbo nucifera]|uniref:Probable sodium-coupled neutral amino acid transporter 6 isoform X2 n=1 Tax=Nelumbo nucifera TaxID=4432 RepID=A0A1U7ZTT8_NELNU|nr:PREDICTED: probable sodium-coupled neutral amino acid transporter 6 isoform X2 [Nelumbo nucifera]